ncbi:MAG: hypothetical protein IRZ16_16990 [Myxococcaceae bacterium]|nr:hypothetical protein [Myxococcaceae bacterium]
MRGRSGRRSLWLVTVLAAGIASAQALHVTAPRTRDEQLAATVGVEPELISTLSWAHRFSTPGSAGFWAGAGLKLAPATLFHCGALRAQLLAGAERYGTSGFGGGVGAFAYYVRDQSDVGRFDGFGVEVRGGPGYRGQRWSAALDLGYQLTFLTHIAHGPISEATFGDRQSTGPFAGPRDGWYGITAQRFRVGLAGGVAIAQHWSLTLALGSLVSRQRQGIFFGFNAGQFPVYAEAGVLFGWPRGP